MYDKPFEDSELLNSATHVVLNKQLYGRKKGMFVAYSDTNFGVNLPIGIGWALCRTGDHFDKNHGFKIALTRAKKQLKRIIQSADDLEDVYETPNFIELSEIPASIHDDLFDFVCRCKRYFKYHQMPVIVYNGNVIEINCN